MTARFVPRFLWTTASIDVYLDNVCVLQTGGQMKLNGYYSSNFTHLGQTHVAVLSWGTGVFMSFPYALVIDGIPIRQGRVRVRNWILGFLPLVFSFSFMAVAFYVLTRVVLKLIPH